MEVKRGKKYKDVGGKYIVVMLIKDLYVFVVVGVNIGCLREWGYFE